MPERDINLVIGVHGEAIPLVLTDALWSRFKIGEQYEVTDGGTKAPGVRNVFTAANATAAGLVTRRTVGRRPAEARRAIPRSA